MKTDEEINRDEIIKQFEDGKKKIIEICAKEVDAVLKKHDCKISISGSFVNNELKTQVSITKL
jgi:non-homologous end joining protein Ku